MSARYALVLFPDISVRHRRILKKATVGGKLFYTSNSKKFMKHSCTNIQFSDTAPA